MNRRIVSLFALVAVGLVGTAARASLVYQYVADISSFTAPAGTSVAINIYLQETFSGASTDLLLSKSGLRSAGFQLSRPGSVADGGATLTGAVDQTGAGGNFAGGTGFTAVTFPAVSFANTESVSALAPGGPTGQLNGSVREVLLGTVSLTVGTVGSTFTLGARDLSNTNTTFFNPGGDNGLDLDSTLGEPFDGASDFTFNIILNPTPVPEPGTALLLGGGIAGLVMLGRNRRG